MKGFLGKNYGATEKNRIAMSFVDLHERVIYNQHIAMQDKKLETMSKREQEFYL